ncbi:hypothetical protein KEM52_003997 [Ascosphaera acerosa]|nr:hypothetical protein KEM52_003997 [Ascosphaera acerosa]
MKFASSPVPEGQPDNRAVFFFDIDNCLYSKECKIHDMMAEYINNFFVKHLHLTPEDSHMLHNKYYKEYGLAIRGLNAHHQISAVDFNREVDDALPLETTLRPDPRLRRLLEDIDKTKVKLWLFTNAYINHARRVIKLLEIEGLFEGCTFCDYHDTNLVCKPEKEMFEKAEREAGVKTGTTCYFIGWRTVHFVEPSVTPPEEPASAYLVRHLENLRTVFPDLFKARAES